MLTRRCKHCGRDKAIELFGRGSLTYVCTVCSSSEDETAAERAAREASWLLGSLLLAATIHARHAVQADPAIKSLDAIARAVRGLNQLEEAEGPAVVDAVLGTKRSDDEPLH
jgi:hypothetical protein